jgi:hypothetical protein
MQLRGLKYTDSPYYPDPACEAISWRDTDELGPHSSDQYVVELPVNTLLIVTLNASRPVELSICDAAVPTGRRQKGAAVWLDARPAACRSELRFQTTSARRILFVVLTNRSGVTARTNVYIASRPFTAAHDRRGQRVQEPQRTSSAGAFALSTEHEAFTANNDEPDGASARSLLHSELTGPGDVTSRARCEELPQADYPAPHGSPQGPKRRPHRALRRGPRTPARSKSRSGRVE